MTDEQVGYSKDRCYFCGKFSAGYQRYEDDKPHGKDHLHEACEKCARVPYPQPKQFQIEEKTNAI